MCLLLFLIVSILFAYEAYTQKHIKIDMDKFSSLNGMVDNLKNITGNIDVSTMKKYVHINSEIFKNFMKDADEPQT